jgi:hypothetical protein
LVVLAYHRRALSQFLQQSFHIAFFSADVSWHWRWRPMKGSTAASPVKEPQEPEHV